MKKLFAASLLLMFCLSFGCQKDIVVPDSPIEAGENAVIGSSDIDNL